MFIEIIFKMLLFKGGVLIYAEHCVYIYIYIYIFHGAQTSVCVTNYVHISTLYRQTTLIFICQMVNSDRFLETLFCTRSFTSLLRFGSLNTLLTLPVEKDCVGKAKPVTLFY